MTLYDIVTDFEYAKKIFDIGLREDFGIFWYKLHDDGTKDFLYELVGKKDFKSGDVGYPAPTAEEYKLPEKIEMEGEKYILDITYSSLVWYVGYIGDAHRWHLYTASRKLCNAMAEMQITLHELIRDGKI